MKHIGSLLLLTLIGWIAFGYGIGKRDLWAPDEPRFGQVAREMLQRRDPFVLHVNDEPYTDKPPMVMWIAAALQWNDPEHVSNFAVRFPSVLGGLIGVWVTYALGALMFGSSRAGFLSATVAATMLMIAWQANRAQLDMLMAGWSYVSILAFWMAREAKRSTARTGWWALFWIAAALGTLSKGPPALICPLGAVAFFLMWERDQRLTLKTAVIWTVGLMSLTLLALIPAMQGTAAFLVLFAAIFFPMLGWSLWRWLRPASGQNAGSLLVGGGRFLLGIAAWAAVVGIWFIPYKMNAPPEASQDTLLTQTVVRYFQGINHISPPWFYLTHLPHNLLPWTVFCAAAIFFARRLTPAMPRVPWRLLVCWILFTVIFFSLTPGKRDQYLLPCIPAFALFTGWYFDRLFKEIPSSSVPWLKVGGWINFAVAAILAVGILGFKLVFVRSGGLGADWLGRQFEEYQLNHSHLEAMPLFTAALFFAVVAGWFFFGVRRTRPRHIFAATATFMAGALFLLNGFILPRLNPMKSGRIMSETIAQYRVPSDRPVGIYNLFRADYIVYGDYFLEVFDENVPSDMGEMREYMASEKPSYLIVRTGGDEEEVAKHLGGIRYAPLFETKIGKRALTVFGNAAALASAAPAAED